LLAQAEALARDEGYRQLSLLTHTENRAQRLYHRMGFRESERCEDPAYKRLAGVSGRVLMVKSLLRFASEKTLY
jgi:ribosomal protein S18 acetylase RimI-like enzyme